MRTKITVAYADDHDFTRTGLKADLGAFEHISVDFLASNGLALVNILEQCDILPDVCLIDINMPVMNGFGLQEYIRRRWPSMGTIAFTFYDDETYIARMISLGVNAYLLKSSPVSEVADAITAVYHNGFYYSSVADRNMFVRARNKKEKPVQFSHAEIDLLKMSGPGLSYAEIAEKLSTTTKAVTSTRDRLFNKLGISSRIELYDYALDHGFVIRNPKV